MDNGEIYDKLNKHDTSIELISRDIKSLAESTTRIGTGMEKVVESMGKQELILEKLTNLEDKTDERLQRIHKRIDDCESANTEIFKIQSTTGCTALKLNKSEDSHRDTEIKTLNDALTEITKTQKEHSTKLTKVTVYGSVAGVVALVLVKAVDFSKLWGG